jgi:hypothetical protein
MRTFFWDHQKQATIAGRHYIIPEDYSRTALADDGKAILIDVSRKDFSALANDRPGWNDNILIMVAVVPNKASELWETIGDGSPLPPSLLSSKSINREYENMMASWFGSILMDGTASLVRMKKPEHRISVL